MNEERHLILTLDRHAFFRNVVAASFVQQYSAEVTRQGGDAGQSMKDADRYMDEALAVGVVALHAFEKIRAKESK